MPNKLSLPRLLNKPAAAVRADAQIAGADRASLKINATDVAAEIYLYSEIGYWGITAGQFADALNAQRGKSITLRINSPGGDVFDGLAMYSLLSTWPAPVTAQIDGLAASAASVVMLGASSVSMTKGAFVMVHNAWGVSLGNANDMRDFASVLDQIDANLADLYAAKSGASAKDWRDIMSAETWFNADQAIAAKLVDNVIDAPAAKAALGPALYRNAPKELLEPSAIGAEARDRMARRLDLMRRSA